MNDRSQSGYGRHQAVLSDPVPERERDDLASLGLVDLELVRAAGSVLAPDQLVAQLDQVALEVQLEVLDRGPGPLPAAGADVRSIERPEVDDLRPHARGGLHDGDTERSRALPARAACLLFRRLAEDRSSF